MDYQIKTAHKPHINQKMHDNLVSPRSYADGMAKMMHFIDEGKNHSKFYEMVIIPDEDEDYTLVRMWGALTDLPANSPESRVQTKIMEGLSLGQAQQEMAKISMDKLRKGYKDTFKTSRGQYPIGLTRQVGFGWGTQEITRAPGVIPALRKLIADLDQAIDSGLDGDVDGVSVALAEMGRLLLDLPDSTMAREIEKKLKAPANRLLGTAGYNADPRLIARDLKVVKNYLTQQLSAEVSFSSSLEGRRLTANNSFEIRWRVLGGSWKVKKFRNGREYEMWADKMYERKVPFELDADSVEGHSEEYLRSLL